MTAAAVDTRAIIGVDAWGLAEEADRRFRRVARLTSAPILAAALLLPWIQLQLDAEPAITPIPQRIALLPDPPTQRAQPIEPEAKSLPDPADKPTTKADAPRAPKPQPTTTLRDTPAAPSARQAAEQAGLATMRDQLQSLRSAPSLLMGADAPLRAESTVGDSARSTLGTPTAATHSGGIGSSTQHGVAGATSGADLGTRRTTAVQDRIGSGRGAVAAQGNGQRGAAAAGRSLQELQLAFDRSQAAFASIFNRSARETPGMGSGRIVLSLTIAPDGSVMQCQIVSSSFANPDLEQKILQRVKLMNFGARDVPVYTYPQYPLIFLPS